ncbi:MAG: hypothetical protein H7146_11365 [Burkholderiaceae bacterium]|nr:hypothetical protein [Microbacteriaceae bacterium]
MRASLIALVFVGALSLSGCTPTQAEAEVPVTASPSTPPTVSAAPSASPSPTSDTVALPDCRELLGAEGVAKLDAPGSGLVLRVYGPDDQLDPASPEGRMLAAGGSVCNTGPAATDNGFVYGYVPTAGVDLADLRAAFDELGYESAPFDGGENYCLTIPDFASPCHVIIGDDWFLTTDMDYLPTLQAAVAGR